MKCKGTNFSFNYRTYHRKNAEKVNFLRPVGGKLSGLHEVFIYSSIQLGQEGF